MKENRYIWVDNLRSFLTLLVVAHHSSLAYTTFARFDKSAYINSTHPIVDAHRWVALDIFENFNDVFFMSLMFLIGGLFLSKSIAKKGFGRFIRDRAYRLFIPFLLLGTFFMLIAHFPSYYVSHTSIELTAYIKDFFTTEKWPVGPPWFIWVLFVFNILFIFVNPVIQRNKFKISILIDNFQHKPVLLYLLLWLITWILYVPIAYNVGAGTWTGWLPFDFQLSRILLYFGYFLIGTLVGNTDFNHKIFAKNSVIIKSWWIWIILSCFVYILLTISPAQLIKMAQKTF